MRAVVVELVEHVLDLAAGDVDAQVVAGDGFDRVRFVEDHDVVVGQDAHAGPPQRDVAEQQRVIHDEDLRVLHAAAVLVVEALVVRRAAAAHAVAAVAGDFVPHLAERLERQIAERAVGGRLAPLANLAELLELLVVVEQTLAAGERRGRAAAG